MPVSSQRKRRAPKRISLIRNHEPMEHPQLQKLRQVLTPADLIENVEVGERTVAAVLIPLFVSGGELRALFIRRSERISRHQGQIAFPGGRAEAHDPSLLVTALREAHEEVGLRPETVSVLGRLNCNFTNTSRFAVTPFVGLIPDDAVLRPDDYEVAEIFSVSFAALRDPGLRGELRWDNGESVRIFPAIRYDGRTIWGLTYRIIEELLSLLPDE
jgi:8-oxo-dGTP pyrophosphatase MutT (NUDIX family)